MGESSGRVLLIATDMDAGAWRSNLAKGREVVVHPEGAGDPSITYAVVWKQPPGFLASLPNLKAVFSIGAGVDHVLADKTLPADLPIVRVINDNLSQHMCEYVVWRVLDHQRRGASYRRLQLSKAWRPQLQPTAQQVTVGIMGFGALGSEVAETLVALGFRVNGWSRTERRDMAVKCFAGKDGLEAFLSSTDILVVLLPLTDQTQGIVDYALLSKLRRDGPLGGPVLINAGRGGLQEEADIIRALDDGVLLEASLDVFQTEPLPASSPLWDHPGVTITPHAAAESDPSHLVPPMLEQMDAHDHGAPLQNLVDREAGY